MAEIAVGAIHFPRPIAERLTGRQKMGLVPSTGAINPVKNGCRGSVDFGELGRAERAALDVTVPILPHAAQKGPQK